MADLHLVAVRQLVHQLGGRGDGEAVAEAGGTGLEVDAELAVGKGKRGVGIDASHVAVRDEVRVVLYGQVPEAGHVVASRREAFVRRDEARPQPVLFAALVYDARRVDRGGSRPGPRDVEIAGGSSIPPIRDVVDGIARVVRDGGRAGKDEMPLVGGHARAGVARRVARDEAAAHVEDAAPRVDGAAVRAGVPAARVGGGAARDETAVHREAPGTGACADRAHQHTCAPLRVDETAQHGAVVHDEFAGVEDADGSLGPLLHVAQFGACIEREASGLDVDEAVALRSG